MFQNIVFISHWDLSFVWYIMLQCSSIIWVLKFFWCVNICDFVKSSTISVVLVTYAYKSMTECSVIHFPLEKAASPNSAVNSNQGEINLIWPGVSSGQLFSWLTWKWCLLYKSGYYHNSTVITVSNICPSCLLRQYLYSSSELCSQWESSGLWLGVRGSCIILS